MRKFTKPLLLFLSLFFISTHIYSQGKNIRLLGKLNPGDISYSALWGYQAPDGREYAILGGDQGTYFIDVTDSTNIHTVSFLPSINSEWREMKTYSHYAYIVSEGNNTGVQIVDLAGLPNSIRYVGKYSAPNHLTTHTISQEGPFLYLNGSNLSFGSGVAVLDLSINPESPVLRGKWNVLNFHDCRVLNDTIWACNILDLKVTAIDAKNKDSLKTITSWVNGPNPFPHNCALAQGRKFLYVTDETFNPPGRLKVWNIQDMSNITLEKIWVPGSLFVNDGIHNVELYGNQLLCAYYTAGVKLLDVSNPIEPAELGWYETTPENIPQGDLGCWAVYKFPSGKIIASDIKKGLFVLRYTSPQNAKPIPDFMLGSSQYNVNDSVQFIDCSFNNPTNFEWTITGPGNYYSNGVNPKVKITQIGYYTVKLKVSNAFGSDSLSRINFLRMNGSFLNSFTLYGNLVQRIFTNNNDTSKVNFQWSNSASGLSDITYKFRIKKSGAGTEFFYNSNNKGSDTSITFTKSKLDSIGNQLGLNGDSVAAICRVTAYRGSDSLISGNSLFVTLKSTTVGIQNISSQIPDSYKLENNYPNPFNPSTNIKFQIPERTYAKLTIYDMLGREVKILLSEVLNEGYYNYQFDAKNLSSGIFYYKLETEKFSEIRKMMLIK